MRTIGVAERALIYFVKRSLDRVAFGKQLAELGGNYDVIADCRMEIEDVQVINLQSCRSNGQVGKIAKSDIAQIKVAVPKNGSSVLIKLFKYMEAGHRHSFS